MQANNTRSGFLRAFALLTGCAATLVVTGCFGRPPTTGEVRLPSNSVPLEQPTQPADDPIEARIPPVEIPQELPIEEPIRPIEPVEEPTMEEMADFDGDGVIDENDFETFRDVFGQQADDGSFNPAADFDGDGEITLIDFQIFLELMSSGTSE